MKNKKAEPENKALKLYDNDEDEDEEGVFDDIKIDKDKSIVSFVKLNIESSR